MLWDNERLGLTTEFNANSDGVFRLFQYKIGGKLDRDRILVWDYAYRVSLFTHFFLFCVQTGIPVPFREDWNKRFYQGKFDEKEIDRRLQRLLSREVPLARLVEEGSSSIEEETLRKDVDLIVQYFDKNVKICPLITKGEDLGFIALPESRRVVLLGKEDMPLAFDEIICQMFEHRGDDKVPGMVYSRFPFELYD